MRDPRPPERGARQDETADLGPRDGPESTSAEEPGVFATGSTIAERYRIEAFLARGGMGEVYQALDLDLDVPVAIKTIRSNVSSDPRALRQFKREVLLARSVAHPNVCRIYDLARDAASGVAFLTMEFLPGETLRSRIRRTGPMNASDALPLVRQLAGALDAAHLASVVHRDLKSSNVMLVPAEGGGERAVITDFGLAIPWSSQEVEAFVGTPAYMSPEQVTGGAIGPASDLYSLGVVLYELSTGQLPFDAANPIAMALDRLSLEPAPPSTHAPVDPSWERAILRLLAREPEDRFPNALDLVRSLEGVEVTTSGTRYSLPAERDEFVARADDLRELAVSLETPAATAENTRGTGRRLLTVHAAGGTGKTRLALRYGWESLGRWPGGVWFCDLSEARDRDGVVQTVASVLEVPLAERDPAAQIGHALANRGRCLVLLDNFEQVAPHVEATLGVWLRETTEARFLVTSRETLRIPGERVFELEPLEPTTAGVELFLLRAQEHRPALLLDVVERRMVQEISVLLEGLPLAIELAAARLRTLTLAQLRDRLEDRLRTLTGGSRGRHETLRATLDWSWELLHDSERSALAQLSVFESGFTLEAAEAVVGLPDAIEAPTVIDLVQSLVDKSWLRARSVLGAPRFELSASVKEYASGRMPAGLAAGVESRHGRFYVGRFPSEEASARLGRTGLADVPELLLEADNLLAACRRSIERADLETAVPTFEICQELAELRGPVAPVAALGEELLERCVDPAARSRVLVGLSRLELIVGRFEAARAHLEESLAHCQALRLRRREGVALALLAGIDRRQQRGDLSRTRSTSALEIAREIGDRDFEAAQSRNLALMELQQGRRQNARAFADQALSLYRELGNLRGEARVLEVLSVLDRGEGRFRPANEHLEAALAIQRKIRDQRAEANLLRQLAILERMQARRDPARHHVEAALAAARAIGDRALEGGLLVIRANLHADEGELSAALPLYERSREIAREQGDGLAESQVLHHLASIHAAQGELEQALEECEGALTAYRTSGVRRGQAIVLTTIAEVLSALGESDSARVHADSALEIATELRDSTVIARALHALGEVCETAGDQRTARELYEQVLVVGREIGDQEIVGAALGRLASVHLRRGRLEEALRLAADASRALRDTGNRLAIVHVECTAGRCEAASGDFGAARQRLLQIEELTRPLGLTARSTLAREIAELRAALGP